MHDRNTSKVHDGVAFCEAFDDAYEKLSCIDGLAFRSTRFRAWHQDFPERLCGAFSADTDRDWCSEIATVGPFSHRKRRVVRLYQEDAPPPPWENPESPDSWDAEQPET